MGISAHRVIDVTVLIITQNNMKNMKNNIKMMKNMKNNIKMMKNRKNNTIMMKNNIKMMKNRKNNIKMMKNRKNNTIMMKNNIKMMKNRKNNIKMMKNRKNNTIMMKNNTKMIKNRKNNTIMMKNNTKMIKNRKNNTIMMKNNTKMMKNRKNNTIMMKNNTKMMKNRKNNTKMMKNNTKMMKNRKNNTIMMENNTKMMKNRKNNTKMMKNRKNNTKMIKNRKNNTKMIKNRKNNTKMMKNNRSCHGPLRNIRHSHGRRCPRNQPAALWELLQQTLARKHKVSPWTKTQLLSWSPTHTGSAYWLHYMRPAQHSQTRPQSRGNNKTAPTLSGPGPTTSGLLQPPSSPGFLPLPHTTEHPEVLDSLLPDLDRSHVTRRRDPVGLSMPPSSPPAASQPVPTRTHGLRLTTPPSSLMRSVKHDAVQDPQLDILLHSPPPQLSEDSESEYAHHIRYKSRLRRRHHHRHHLTDPRDRPPHNSLEEAHVPQFTRPTGDQRMTSWSGLVPQGKPQHPVFSLPDHAPPAQPTTIKALC
ncbi:hypothetical protein Hamer_G026908 [Homarus americanus]|uniref:Uncharacterized protein n=1 Tax=Homarus americanus TaxID=6706 RepID=A0A8J5JB78_HOMAM|nr:hypothetical protein Hamer_G026908 [Homarus americanus]